MTKKGLSVQPTFIISLDVELLWGLIPTRDKYSQTFLSLLTSDAKNGRGAIDFLLNVFEKYDIPATWAIVGHLFLDHCESDPLYHGKDIVKKIISSTVNHEIGYHSFSHVLFSECSREIAEAEIKKGLKLAKEFGITPKSFVFPWNKIGHVDILTENGFEIYRGKNGRWDAGQRFLARMVNGAIDKIIASPTEPTWRNGIWQIPSSMTFFDSQVPTSLLTLKAKIGICRAIRSNRVFHVFLHPHNLLYSPLLAKEFETLLAFASKKRDDDGLRITTMGEFASYLNQKFRKRRK